MRNLLRLLLLALIPFIHHYSQAQVTSCSPSSSPRSNILTLTLSGAGMDFTAVTIMGIELKPAIGPSIYTSNSTVINMTTLQTDVTIPATAFLGTYQIRVDPYPMWSGNLFTVTAGGGGNLGTVSGTVFMDDDTSCTQNGGEASVDGALVHILPDDYYTLTDASGAYIADLPLGSHTIEVIPRTHHTVLCPSGAISANLTAGGQVLSGNNFGMGVEHVSDVGVNSSVTQCRPGFNQQHMVFLENLGYYTASGTLRYLLDTNFIYVSASSPQPAISGDTLTWAFTGLLPGEIRTYQVETNLLPSVALGTILFCTTSVAIDSVDVDTENNVYVMTEEVVGSYDPNDKMVWDQDMNPADPNLQVTDSILNFRIRFQNTGTASAIHVFIRDTLDPLLDLSTLETIGASHPYTAYMDGNGNMEWRFANINLPDSNSNEPGSHGYVMYRVKLKPSFTTGMYVRNQAHIYFDFNTPVATNITSSSIFVAIDEITAPNPLQVYPNPATSTLYISCGDIKQGNTELALYNSSGQAVRRLTQKAGQNGLQAEIDVADLPAGVYFLRAQNGRDRFHQKVAIFK